MGYVFVKRLGISALVGEAVQAWSTDGLSQLVHCHGGRPIGSFDVDEVSSANHRKAENKVSIARVLGGDHPSTDPIYGLHA